ncbi:MAG: HAD family phosphatase [Bacteroidota bacterium]
MTQKAFLFDLNGTMVDDMDYHIRAWYRILNELGAGISLEQTKLECYGKNHELLERVFPGRFTNGEKDRIGMEKEKQYQQQFAPELKLIDGLADFLEVSYKKGIRMAIGSAAIMYNIDFVLEGLNIRHYFDSIVSADDVMISKPDPETYLQCALQLNVPAADCIVFEDSPKGVESAKKAGMKSVVLTTMHEAHEFLVFDNVLFSTPDYKHAGVSQLLGSEEKLLIK